MKLISLNIFSEILIQELVVDNQKSNPANAIINHETLYGLLKPYQCKLSDINEKVEALIKAKIYEEDNSLENPVRRCIFKFLEKLYLITTQEERLHHFDDLLYAHYENITQKLIELNRNLLLLSKVEFFEIVKTYIPFVKLQIILNKFNDESVDNQNDVLIQEIIEFLQNPVILREEVYRILREKLTLNNLELSTYNYEEIKTEGFLGRYATLKVNVKREDKTFTYDFFIKSLPGSQHDKLRLEVSVQVLNREKLFYAYLPPLLKKIGITDLDIVPKNYSIYSNDLVLEDLSVLNYSQFKDWLLDYEHLSLAIKGMAKLHSITLILEEKLSKELDDEIRIYKFIPILKEDMQLSVERMNIANIEFVISVLEKYSHATKDVTMEKIINVARKKLNEIFTITSKSKRYRNVVNQGDIWANNIFYRWDENEKPTDCILFDFQLIRYCPQIVDILVITHVAADKEMRDKYMDILLRDYYNELKLILQTHEIDIEKISPYEDLVKSYDEFKIFGIFIGIYYTSVGCVPDEIKEKFFSDPEKAYKYWVDSKYRCEVLFSISPDTRILNRLEEFALELYDLCLKCE